ncbi:MAG: ArsR/SmtB family transcription factor [Anaerolineae bacterium]
MTSPPTKEINLLHANVCQAVADPKRILILYALHERPYNVTHLAETLSLPQPTVSRHLRVLRQQGLVTTERNGTAVTYDIADRRIIQALDLLRAVMNDVVRKRSNLITGE